MRLRIAVTGGSGFVGAAIVRAAIAAGHEVRAIMRHPPDPRRIAHDSLFARADFRAADITKAETLRGVFSDCDVVVHAAGIAREARDGPSFDSLNVHGTRNVLAECAASAVPHVVFVSSLGAERGNSNYHRSKRQAEQLVREYAGTWTILRPGNAYGPGGGQIALFMQLIRTLPVVPLAGDPDEQFQPIAVEDLASAVLACFGNDQVSGRTLDLAGDDITSQRDLYERISTMVNRHPPMVPVPATVAVFGSELLDLVGIEPPVWRDQLVVVSEGNVLLNRNHSALREVLGIAPRSLELGLRSLATRTPEQFPESGTGNVTRRRFWVEIGNSSLSPAQVIDVFRREFAELMPHALVEVGSEEVSEEQLGRGATISLALPARGHVQVRVAEVTPYTVTCVTLQGHPLAGVVRFMADSVGDHLRFEVQTIDRPHSTIDHMMMSVIGTHLKRITWMTLLEHIVERSGGSQVGTIHVEETEFDDVRSQRFDDWVHELVANGASRNSGF